jgi:hypothetical protein
LKNGEATGAKMITKKLEKLKICLFFVFHKIFPLWKSGDRDEPIGNVMDFSIFPNK